MNNRGQVALRGSGRDSGKLKSQPVTQQNAGTTDQCHLPATTWECRACCPIPQLSQRGQKCTFFLYVNSANFLVLVINLMFPQSV